MSKVILKNELNHVINFDGLNKDSIILDIGAAVGGFVEEMRNHEETKDSKIICVECSKKNINKFKAKNFENVIMVEKAMGGTDEGVISFTEFVGQPKGDGNHKYYQWGNTENKHEDKLSKDKSVEIIKYDVPLISIKGLMGEHGIETVDYLKMDIEGAEYSTLFALDQETANKINQLSFETHDLSRNKELISHLNTLGFIVEKYDKDEYYAYR